LDIHSRIPTRRWSHESFFWRRHWNTDQRRRGAAQPYPYTLLPLADYARILGLNPLHFAGALTPGLTPQIYPANNCSDVWKKYDWQDHDKVSLYQIAQLIHDAEHEISNFIGYYPAPYWVIEEHVQYPRPYLREGYGNGLDVRDRPKTMLSEKGKFIMGGRRAVTLVGTATTAGGSLVYSDDDGDGFLETATVTLPTTLTNAAQIKVYVPGMDGSLDWEVRPTRTKVISGGFVVIALDSWLLIDPELYELPPTSDGEEAIDASTAAPFLSSVDVYREYADQTVASAVFFWGTDAPINLFLPCPSCGTIGCTACSYDTQDGCVTARNLHNGELVAVPATYNADSGAWAPTSWLNCVEPDFVNLYYVSGDQSQEYLQGRSTRPLAHFWAQIIAWIATARLDRPVCACGNVKELVDWLGKDLAFAQGNERIFLTDAALNSPFGTRRGEVMAWRRLSKLAPKRRMNVAVIS